MQSKTAISSRGIFMLTALLGVLLVNPVFAQEAAEPEAAAVTAQETDVANEPTGESAGAPAAVESGVVLDYEPTESISEDLSVSFPVDI